MLNTILTKKKTKATNKLLLLAIGLLVILLQTSCKKFIEVSPPINSTNAAIVYNDPTKAAAVLTGIYTNLSKGAISTGGFSSISLSSGLAADELTLFELGNTSLLDYYRNQLSNQSTSTFSLWNIAYQYIYTTNDALEGLTQTTDLSLGLKQQLLGEAKFIRAFCYFYLVNLYGDVPLALTTNYKVNATLSRSPKTQVWQQIIDDLKAAQSLLSDKYLKSDAVSPYPGGSEERVRPTKWAATALLARAYLYNSDYVNSEIQSAAVINNSSLYDTVALNSVFLKNSKEAIWQLQPVGIGTNSNAPEGRLFILPATGPNSQFPVYLSNHIMTAFETGDQRKVNWTNSVTPSGASTYNYVNKYKIGISNVATSEYSVVLRLAEQYLIRAEARAHLGNVSGAQSDLNIIRKRARLSNTTANDESSLLSGILQERKVEFFTEWGHRWLDIKRMGVVDNIMTPICAQKGGAWNSNWTLYPILLSELQKNQSLLQNPGY